MDYFLDFFDLVRYFVGFALFLKRFIKVFEVDICPKRVVFKQTFTFALNLIIIYFFSWMIFMTVITFNEGTNTRQLLSMSQSLRCSFNPLENDIFCLLFAICFLRSDGVGLCLGIFKRREVFFALKKVKFLGKESVIIVRNLLILFFCLDLATIAFLPEGKV